MPSNNITSIGGINGGGKIKIQTYGPRGRSGSSKNNGSGWSQIKNVSWDVSSH